MRSVGRYVVALAAILSSTRAAGADLVVRGETTRIDAAKLERLARLELGDAADIEHVLVNLENDKALLVLELRDGRRRESVIALPARGGDVERTIALLIGEASREQDVPTSPPPAAKAAAPVPVPAETTTPLAALPRGSDENSYAVFAGIDTSVFAARGAFFVGPTLGADVTFRRLTFALRGRYAVSSANDPLGTVDARLVTARPSVSYRLLGREVLSLGVGAGVDAAWIGGSANGARAHSASGFGIGPNAYLEGRAAIAERWRLALAVEGGWLGPGLDLRAENRTVLAVSGFFVGSRLDVGVRF